MTCLQLLSDMLVILMHIIYTKCDFMVTKYCKFASLKVNL